MGEGAQDPAGFLMPPGGQGQALEADHGVAAPVGEPVVAGDHGERLIAGGMGARGILAASRRRDQKLVGGKHQFRQDTTARAARAFCDQTRRRRRAPRKASS